MTIPDELRMAVEAAFVVTGRDTPPWEGPDPMRERGREEYSRVTRPEKWRILGARADAWMVALHEMGLAEVERDAEVTWREPPGTTVTRTDRAVPRAAGALPLVVARSRLGGDDEAGLTLGMGEPAVLVAAIPACGCDACDHGSVDELDRVDEHIIAVISGRHSWLAT